MNKQNTSSTFNYNKNLENYNANWEKEVSEKVEQFRNKNQAEYQARH